MRFSLMGTFPEGLGKFVYTMIFIVEGITIHTRNKNCTAYLNLMFNVMRCMILRSPNDVVTNASLIFNEFLFDVVRFLEFKLLDLKSTIGYFWKKRKYPFCISIKQNKNHCIKEFSFCTQ
jgi:hypothetical protein